MSSVAHAWIVARPQGEPDVGGCDDAKRTANRRLTLPSSCILVHRDAIFQHECDFSDPHIRAFALICCCLIKLRGYRRAYAVISADCRHHQRRGFGTKNHCPGQVGCQLLCSLRLLSAAVGKCRQKRPSRISGAVVAAISCSGLVQAGRCQRVSRWSY